MRFSPCLVVIAGLSACTHAFFPYELKPSANSVIPSAERRFVPYSLWPPSNDDSPEKPPTLEVRKLPVRRDTYNILQSHSPNLPHSAPLSQDGKDFSYFAVVKVGSQDQHMWLALDTGAPSTWVYDSSCTLTVCTRHHTFNHSLSTTFTPNSTTFSLGYGSGSIRGGLGTDTLSVAGLSVQLVFGLVTKASSFFNSYPFDGILGLGRSGTAGWSLPSFMDMVAADNLLPANIVGFCLSRQANNPKDGEVNFGIVDKTKFDGSITYTGTVSNTWTIPLDDAYVNGQAAGLTGKSATIDTGTSYILIPPADAQSLSALIPGSAPSGSEKYIIPCNSTATLQFSFSGVKYKISPLDYVGPKTSGGCFSTIVGRQTGGANEWLVGDVFLKNVYTVFDFDNAQIGFARRAPTPSSGNRTFNVPSGAGPDSTGSAKSAKPSDSSASQLAFGGGWSVLSVILGMLFV